ncbi:hypothetical protein OIV83_003603 [Microbotryomycetes sp. JL201]|nr:hypothetical protein OIV83_003603 [Microbotryomycetes sp. JL201]
MSAMDDGARGSFRPTRNSASKRASLGAMPGAPLAAAGLHENAAPAAKELHQRKKRALSLGGGALERVVHAKSVLELSPGHQARRKMAPRRSILKSASSNSLTADWTGTLDAAGAHTTDLSTLSSFNMRQHNTPALPVPAGQDDRGEEDNEEDDNDDDDDSEDGTMDMDLTRMSNTTGAFLADRRKSAFNRRVSFAPSAHIRTFTPDKPTAQAQALLHAQKQAIAAAVQAGIDTAAAAHHDATNWSSDEDEQDQDGSFAESEPSMELAADEVTHAFRGHFAGTKLPVSVLTGQEQEDDDQDDDDADDTMEDQSRSDDGTVDMDEANTGEITKAFAHQQTSVFNSQQPPSANVSAAPPASSIRSPGKKPRFSEVVRKEDAEDDEIMRQLGLTKGGPPLAERASLSGLSEPAIEPADDTAATELMLATGGLTHAANLEDATMDMSMVDKTVDMSMADKTMELDQTADMQDATTFGRILSTNTSAPASGPSTPNSRRQSLARSPRRLSVKSPRSPRRLANPPTAEAFAQSQSPAKSLSSLPPTQLASPLNLAAPIKEAPGVAAEGSAVAVDVTNNLTVPIKTPPRAVVSPLKSSLTPGRTPRSGFTPRVLVPPQSAGRSPGGSLSLRGLLQEQMASRTTTSMTAAATTNMAATKSPARASPRKTLVGMPSPKRRAESMLESPRVKLARMSEEPGDTSFAEIVAADGDQIPLPILSLDAFFEATETGFMKDVLGMTGVDLGNKRRKSIAPSTGRKASGPPSFADLAVAGGCKSLFHQLYQSDHFRLQEEITNIMDQLDQCEEALKHEQPKIFTEWSSASDARRAALQNQFRMIKAHYYLVGRIEWNECRALNHQSIIEVMEENLEGLRADNAVVEASEFDEVLPALEAHKAALLAELHAERQRDVELSACDQEELDAMHAAVAEQADELEKLERGFDEVAAQLAGLTSKADDLSEQVAKSTAERDEIAQKLEEGRCFTKAEVSRLRAEYEALQQLHGWKLVRFDRHSVQLRHVDDFDVTLLVGVGQLKAVEFAINSSKTRSALDSQVTTFLLDKVALHVQHAIDNAKTSYVARARTIIRRIGSLWLNACRIRKEVLLANHRFPTRAALDASSASLNIVVDVHVPLASASFDVFFELTGEELIEEDSQRPAQLETVAAKIGSDVAVRFGKVDIETLKYIVRERLDAGGRGALIEACNEAEAKYQPV